MSVTVDANVLVYASNTSDPVHAQARALLEEFARGPGLVHLFWPTVMAYLRICTHPAILPKPLAPEAAMDNIAGLIARAHVRTPGEGAGFWDLYKHTAPPVTRGNDVPDAHLAALMRQHGTAVIYTRDRGFRRFDGIQVRDPFSS